MKAAKPFTIIFVPWKKYSGFFDKGCWGIWGLSPLLKYTLLFLALFFVPPIIGLVDYANSYTYFGIITILFLLIAFTWIVYIPILILLELFFALKRIKKIIFNFKPSQIEFPWVMTPKQLYNKPHMAITLYLLYLFDYFLDFVDWTTQFFPMSLMFVNKIKYPLSTKIRHNARHIEIFLATLKIPLKYICYEINMQNTIYKFVPYEKINRNQLLKKLEKGFRGSDFYLREDGEQINIIEPHKLQ